MQDRISELHCLLTGQCCLLAQTKTSGIQLKGMLPFGHLEVDFTEMKPHLTELTQRNLLLCSQEG